MTKMTYLAGLQHFNNIDKLQDLCGFDHQTDISVFHNFELGKPSRKKSAVFLNIVQKAFDPHPPFYLNICPILQGVFFKRVFAGGVF